MSRVRCEARSLALSSATVLESKESGEGGDTATLYWLKQASGKSTLPRHPGHRPLRNARFCRLPSLSRRLSPGCRASVAVSLRFRTVARAWGVGCFWKDRESVVYGR